LLALFPAAVIFAGIRDLTTFTIPNWISLAIIALFFPVALITHLSLPHLEGAVLVGLAALVLGVGLFALGWIGGGDAKLLAASALWMGWPAVLPFLIWTSVAGGLLSVALLASRKVAGYYPLGGPAWFGRLMQPGGPAPYGLAIAAGGLIAFPYSALIHP
jgi:prepilin peptidase CpaA